MSDDFTMLDYPNTTPDDLRSACQRAIDHCDAALDAMLAIVPESRTFANTLLALEAATDIIGTAAGTWAFLSNVSPDDALRDAAREWDEKFDKYLVDLSFREDIYAAVRAFAATPEASQLTGEDARLLQFELRDYRRNGFDLPPEPRARLRQIFDSLIELDVQFRKELDEWDDGILVSHEELDGLPESFIGGLKTVDEGGFRKFRVTLDYPELYPFLGNAKSEERRKELFIKDQCKGGEANLQRLEEAIRLRAEAASLLGYDSWAAYKTETRMAKTRETVERFLGELIPRVQAKAELDFARMRRASIEDRGTSEVNIWDWRYLHTQLLKSDYAVDEFAVAAYFPLDACLEGLFKVTQEILGVRYVPRPDAPVWHPDVQAFDVYDEPAKEGPTESGEPFARFYMDLFPRPNKYGHAAAFTLRRGCLLNDGTYQRPISAIVANFTKPTATEPSLLRHSEVETLFHEFGHILHQTLTKAKRGRFSGTSTERDFVEAPSQMLEHWVWEPAVLQSFTRHHETGAPLPQALLDSMIAAKTLDSGVMALRQLFFASLDMAYHSPGFDGDTTATTERLHSITGFPYTPGTHFQSGFGHLFGYDAGYYGYMWSNVFGDDMYTRFEQSSPLDATVGGEYRAKILERGGSVDGDVLVREFLGREPNQEAFLKELGLGSG